MLRIHGCGSIWLKGVEHEAKGRAVAGTLHQANSRTECHATVNTKKVETQKYFDGLFEEAKMAQRGALERAKRRTRKRKSSSGGKSGSSSFDESGS